VTWCSCIACRRADWVRGLARLISSAIRSCVKTGPCTKRKLRLPSLAMSMTSDPRMSDGIRSGVNWTRCAVNPKTAPSVSTKLGLGEAGDADKEAVAAGQNRDQRRSMT